MPGSSRRHSTTPEFSVRDSPRDRRHSTSSDTSLPDSSNFRQLSQENIEYIPTRMKQVTASKPAANPLQFIKVGPCDLYRSAQEQLKKVEEVKKLKHQVKEEAEDWQSNLDNWKSSRRKRQEHIIERVVEVKKLELEEFDRNRRRSKTFNEMMEERNSRGRKVSLVMYKEEDANDLSDLGIGTSSGKSSVCGDYGNDDNQSIMSDREENENFNHRGKNGINGHHDDPSDSMTVSSPEPEEYTYERAIQNYVDFTATRVKSRAADRKSLSSSREELDDVRGKLSNGHSAKSPPPPPTKPRKDSGRLNGLEERRRSSADLNSIPDSSRLLPLPKIDVLKRKELFEKASESNGAPKIATRKSGLSTAQTIKERLSSLEKHTDASSSGSKGSTQASNEISSSLKERLSSLQKQSSTDTLVEKSSPRVPGGDVSIRKRLSQLEKQKSSENEASLPNRQSGDSSHSIKERLSNLDAACQKESAKRVTPDRDPSFSNKLANFRNTETSPQGDELECNNSDKNDKINTAESERSDSPDEAEIYPTKRQQFHRSLDSLDVECSNDVVNEAFERVQSLEELDCCSRARNYPASASSTEMLAFSSQSGDTDREDSGIHTADVSCSVSQADEPVEDGEVITAISNVVPHFEFDKNGHSSYHLDVELISHKQQESGISEPLSPLPQEDTNEAAAFLQVENSTDAGVNSIENQHEVANCQTVNSYDVSSQMFEISVGKCDNSSPNNVMHEGPLVLNKPGVGVDICTVSGVEAHGKCISDLTNQSTGELTNQLCVLVEDNIVRTDCLTPSSGDGDKEFLSEEELTISIVQSSEISSCSCTSIVMSPVGSPEEVPEKFSSEDAPQHSLILASSSSDGSSISPLHLSSAAKSNSEGPDDFLKLSEDAPQHSLILAGSFSSESSSLSPLNLSSTETASKSTCGIPSQGNAESVSSNNSGLQNIENTIQILVDVGTCCSAENFESCSSSEGTEGGPENPCLAETSSSGSLASSMIEVSSADIGTPINSLIEIDVTGIDISASSLVDSINSGTSVSPLIETDSTVIGTPVCCLVDIDFSGIEKSENLVPDINCTRNDLLINFLPEENCSVSTTSLNPLLEANPSEIKTIVDSPIENNTSDINSPLNSNPGMNSTGIDTSVNLPLETNCEKANTLESNFVETNSSETGVFVNNSETHSDSVVEELKEKKTSEVFSDLTDPGVMEETNTNNCVLMEEGKQSVNCSELLILEVEDEGNGVKPVPLLDEGTSSEIVCSTDEDLGGEVVEVCLRIKIPDMATAEKRKTVVEVCEKVDITQIPGGLKSPLPTPVISVPPNFQEPNMMLQEEEVTKPQVSDDVKDSSEQGVFYSACEVLEQNVKEPKGSTQANESAIEEKPAQKETVEEIPVVSPKLPQEVVEPEVPAVFLPVSTSQIPPLSLSGDIEIVSGLSFPLGPLTSAEPPKEKPPPPPTEVSDEEAPLPESPLRRLDSTKRIKKEIRKKRSDFLGIDGKTDDDSYLEPEFQLSRPPDINSFLVEERRLEQQLYRQSICSESDSNLGETTESRDSGVELDRGHSDDNWSTKQPLTPDVLSAQHSRQNSELYGNASITSEEDEITKKEREIIEILEKEEQWRYGNNKINQQDSIGEKLAEKLRQLEQEKMRLEWERTEEANRRMAEANARREEELRLRAKEEALRQQEENLRSERERLQQEQEALLRQKESLQAQVIHQHQRWSSQSALPSQQWDSTPLPTHLSLQDVSNVEGYPPSPTTPVPARPPEPLNYRLSLPDLQQDPQAGIVVAPASQNVRVSPTRRAPPPIPPSKPLRVLSQEQRERDNSIRSSRMPSADALPQQMEPSHTHHNSVPVQTSSSQQMSRQTLQALSAVPRSRLINNDTWIQAKKKPENQRSTLNNQHWLIQEAEHRRITEQHQRNSTSPRKTLPPQYWAPQPKQPQQPQPVPQRQDKPLPDSIIQTLTQRVQNRTNVADAKKVSSRSRTEESPSYNTVGSSGDSQEKMLSVSGKKKCSHCGDELGRGAAMIIESLRLFYHIDCFKCCVCHVQLGDGLMGTDVRVRNNKLHCHNCYSSDDGVKFSCV